MRSAPATHPGIDRPTHEFRVRFHAPLRDAVAVPHDAPLPPPRTRPAPQPSPPTHAEHSPPAPAPAPPPAEAPPPPDDRERSADREQIEAVLAQLRAAAADLRADQADRLRQWQRAAVELAVTIAARVLHERVAAGEFPMEAKVRDMVAQLGEDSPVTVRLNPADLALLESRLGGEPLLPDRDDPRVIPDPTLNPGECRVEGREAMLLSDVTRELQEIRDELLRSLGNART